MNKDYFITKHDVKTKNSFALDDNIMVRDEITTAGSKMLHNFVSPIEATVVNKLLSAGMELAGKTKLDEFAVPSVAYDAPEVLSGAVGAVSEGECKIALCNDISGKIRRQAPYEGVYYIHPTYGTVSRFGLIPAVSSMDQIGIVCKKLEEGFEALSIIAGHDEKDGTTFLQESYTYTPKEGKFKVGIPSNIINCIDEESKDSIYEFIRNNDVEEFELKYFDYLSQVMYILASAEISNNTSRYDGIKYGYRTKNYTGLNDLYTNTRTEALGLDLKLASIIGAFVLSKENHEEYYVKAMKIRRLIKEHADEIFGSYDAIALPLDLKNSNQYINSGLYSVATLCGLPSVTVPFGSNKGVQLIAQIKNEDVLYGLCKGGRQA